MRTALLAAAGVVLAVGIIVSAAVYTARADVSRYDAPGAKWHALKVIAGVEAWVLLACFVLVALGLVILRGQIPPRTPPPGPDADTDNG